METYTDEYGFKWRIGLTGVETTMVDRKIWMTVNWKITRPEHIEIIRHLKLNQLLQSTSPL